MKSCCLPTIGVEFLATCRVPRLVFSSFVMMCQHRDARHRLESVASYGIPRLCTRCPSCPRTISIPCVASCHQCISSINSTSCVDVAAIHVATPCPHGVLRLINALLTICAGVGTIGVATPVVGLPLPFCIASPRSSLLCSEYLVGVAAMGVVKLGFGLPAKRLTASRCPSSLHSVFCVGVGFPAVL
jgi:hypothetical protein